MRKRRRSIRLFFKTGKGEYGEGDVFIGVVVPDQRRVAKQFCDMQLSEIHTLLNSKIHEHRLTGLLILTYQFEKADPKKQKEIFNFFCRHTARVNNWDLVDLSAPKIVGAFVYTRSRKKLYAFARSQNLWERRIAIVATHYFIQQGDLDDTYTIAVRLFKDTHDLIHKATGWMLREAGKVNQKRLTDFIQKYKDRMPRTTLRYAIERYPEKTRKAFLQKET